MYLDFFDLERKPFELLPNPRFLFPSATHRKALSYLRYGIHEQAGFILLTGEVGAGKTTLIRGIIGELGEDTTLAVVQGSRVDADQLLAMINEEFGLEIAGRDKVALLRDLNDFLIAQIRHGTRPILILDEAQNLSAEALEEIRLLSNLEADDFKLLQIILVGQPELRDLIGQYGLRQLRQRISVQYHIHPLTLEETADYILHRLETAGNREAVTFGKGTFDVIFEHSGGIPRLINVFCDFLLLTAYGEKTHELTLEMVREVVEDAIAGLPIRQSPEAVGAESTAPLGQQEIPVALTVGIFGQETNETLIFQRLALHENLLTKVVLNQEKQLKIMNETLKEVRVVLAGLR